MNERADTRTITIEIAGEKARTFPNVYEAMRWGRDEYHAFLHTREKMREGRLRMGIVLNALRQTVAHGEWMGLLEQFGIHARTAQKAMLESKRLDSAVKSGQPAGARQRPPVGDLDPNAHKESHLMGETPDVPRGTLAAASGGDGSYDDDGLDEDFGESDLPPGDVDDEDEDVEKMLARGAGREVIRSLMFPGAAGQSGPLAGAQGSIGGGIDGFMQGPRAASLKPQASVHQLTFAPVYEQVGVVRGIAQRLRDGSLDAAHAADELEVACGAITDGIDLAGL